MALTSQADLEARWGAVLVRRYLDHDGDGVVDAAPLATVVADTESTVRSILLNKGFTAEQVTLLENDAQLRRLSAEIGIAFASETKVEFLSPAGEGPLESVKKRAIERLKLIATGELRVAAEATVGTKRTGLISDYTTREPVFLVAESERNKVGPGGF